MEEMIFFDNAKDNVTNFFEKEFENYREYRCQTFSQAING